MTKTKGILTIRALSCYYHSKIWLALPEVQAILHFSLSLTLKNCNVKRSLS